MTNTNDARRAHDVLDGLSTGRILSRENEQLLRSFLPELPKQKTLEELRHVVYAAWSGTHGNKWLDDVDGDLETWLAELHHQLQGLKDMPATVPALPEGLRLAIHEEYGCVVVSPKSDDSGVCEILYADNNAEIGSTYDYAHQCELTFVDAALAKPARPEFLETEADYENAPAGTVAAKDGWLAWIKQKNGDWSCDGGYEAGHILAQTGKRRVLRWGWKK